MEITYYYCCPLKLFEHKKIGLDSSLGIQPIKLPLFEPKNRVTMNKGTHFSGQPLYGQLLDLLDKNEILKLSRQNKGERYVKSLDAYQHLAVMLYAVIKRFDSLREDTNLGYPDSQSAFDGHTKAYQTFVELLRTGHNGKDNAYVLRELLHFS